MTLGVWWNSHRECVRKAAGAALAVASALMLAGTLDDVTIAYRVGLLLAVSAATILVVASCCVTERLLERVRQDAYDEGYADGCEVSRTFKVVALEPRAAASSGTGLAVDGAAHQLRQESDVRR